MTIQIDGLSTAQVKLLDIMWSIDSPEVYGEWKQALNLELQNMVDVLEEMVVLATIDQELDQTQDFTETKELLNKFVL
jgi:hypothetical protein